MLDAWIAYVELQVRTNPHIVAKMLIGSFLFNILNFLWILALQSDIVTHRDLRNKYGLIKRY